MKSREAAFLALLQWHSQGTFLWDSLERYKEKFHPEPSDLNFAYELACGSCRMMRYLDAAAKNICTKLPNKPKERMLLRLGLYQRLFCPNIPAYAVVNSTVEVAKKYTYKGFVSFLNALLRKDIVLPEVNPAVRYSITDFFMEELIMQYGKERAVAILEQINRPSGSVEMLYGSESYRQNRTQVKLLEESAKKLAQPPQTILDLCAAPGGKTLLLHKLFPESAIFANEKAAAKIPLLQENISRHRCSAQIICQDGTTFTWHHGFDLIVVDAPCSNSGVLYKCPEARWRLEKEEIARLQDTQVALLKAAYANLNPGGRIIYQTCSILGKEHEEVIARSGMHPEYQLLQLPDDQGHEGGFTALLTP